MIGPQHTPLFIQRDGNDPIADKPPHFQPAGWKQLTAATHATCLFGTRVLSLSLFVAH